MGLQNWQTTFLRLICGLLNPSSGKVLINNREINNNRNKEYTLDEINRLRPQKINLTGRL